MDAPLIDRRAEIRRALETIGFAATAKQVFSCCPVFDDEPAVRRELFEMVKAGQVRVVSEISPARSLKNFMVTLNAITPEGRRK